MIEQIAAGDSGVFHIPDKHMKGVLEGLAQAQSSDFASDEDVDRALRCPWV